MENSLSANWILRKISKQWRGVALFCVFSILCGGAQAEAQKVLRKVLVRDIATISGIRENPLIGYGIVVGLHGTGDSQQTIFTTQALSAAMQKFGVQVPAQSARVNNVAAVFVTASLPPFASPGLSLDINVSSVGDAKSLEGGVLLMTALKGADGQVYALAQGPLTLGGYSVGGRANVKMSNHVTVGSVPNGAVVERDTAIDLNALKTLSFNLRDPDFTAAHDMADAINRELGKTVAMALDSRRVDLDVANSGLQSVTALISRVQNIGIVVHPQAKVVMNERTGTIVMGGDVTLTPVAVLHGNLSIEVTTKFEVSQPNQRSSGETVVVPVTTTTVQDVQAKTIRMAEGASVEELINGLHAIGATARDIVAILQAIKAAGGLQAELEVL
jgi:flagellar P-ring protein precursor FlgI